MLMLGKGPCFSTIWEAEAVLCVSMFSLMVDIPSVAATGFEELDAVGAT